MNGDFIIMRGRAGRAGFPVVMACGVALSLCAQPGSAQTSYHYTGNPFTLFSCGPDAADDATLDCPNAPAPGNSLTSYTATDHVTATLTFSAPLAANLNYQDVTSYAGFQLSMSDGHQTLTTGTATGCCFIAKVSTDGIGQIIGPWLLVVNEGNTADSGIASENEPPVEPFVADSGTLACCDPTRHGDLASNQNLAGGWGATSPAGLSFGTFTRVNQFDSFDNADQIKGGLNVSHTADGAGSSFGENIALANFVPVTLMTSGGPVTVNNGPAAGAWSDSNLGDGSAIGLAFATFNAPLTGPATFRVNAVLDGEFIHDYFGLPDGNLGVAAQVLVVDSAKFGAVLNVAGGNPGQILTGGAPSTNAIDPGAAIAHLDAIAAGTVLGSATYGQNQSFAQFNTLLTVPLNTGLVSVAAGQQFTLIFEVAAESLVGGFAGYSAGTGEANFLRTLQPAANLFTDVNGNPFVGITAAGTAPASSPAPGAISLTTAMTANIVGVAEAMTATVTDVTTAPLPGAAVTFNVTSGPNAGVTGGGITGTNGQAALNYIGNGGVGTDTIQASIGTLLSNVVQVTWALPRIRLQVSPNVVTYPGGASVSVCVTPATKATAAGSAQILDGITTLTTLALQGNGCATWNISPGLNAGTHLLTAAYSGDGNNAPGTSPVVALVVNPATTYLSASCGNASLPYGGNYGCNVNVGSSAGGAVGAITYTFDNNAQVSLPLGNGIAQFSLTTPNTGSHTVTIGYAQQGNFAAAGPSTQNFMVTQASTQVQLTPSNYYPAVGSPLTLSAAVTSSSAGPPASGVVTFLDHGTAIGTGSVSTQGQASLTIPAITSGSHSYVAQFGGLPNFAAGASSGLGVTAK